VYFVRSKLLTFIHVKKIVHIMRSLKNTFNLLKLLTHYYQIEDMKTNVAYTLEVLNVNVTSQSALQTL
jgi:hypothetical protein